MLCRLHHLIRSLAIALLAASAGRAGTPPQPRGLSRAQLATELQRLADGPAFKHARVSLAAVDLVEGETLFEHEPDLLCTVASNNKLVTTAAALELLGPRFQFRTIVAALGKFYTDGALHGDLVLIGGGDPSISGRFHDGKATAVLEQWAAAVAAAGVKSIRGGILADDSYFDRQQVHPDWPAEQRSAWYCAPVSALSFNDNCILVVVQPGKKKGDLAIATTEPRTSCVQLDNRCTTSRARLGNNTVLVHRPLTGNRLSIRGEIREAGAPFRAWVTIDEPPLYAATVFSEILEAKGIKVGIPARLRTPATRIEPGDLREVVTTTSLLADAVTVANSNSQNFYAEQILKTLARERAGKGTWPAGVEVVAAFLRQAGVRGVFSYCDGSGLARTNRFSARQLVTLLAYMNGRRTGSLYLHSLAEPGEGTLARRLGPLEGRLFAKTGYIAGVSALSGYVETRGKRLVAFSILVDGFHSSLGSVRQVQDAICLRLADYEP